MKILFLIDTLDIGGAEQSTLNLCRKFRNTQAAVCHIYRGDRLKPAFQEAGINVISLNLEGRFSYLKAKKAVKEVIRHERPELIHSILFRAGVVARLAVRSQNLPLVDSFVNDSYAETRWKSLSFKDRMKLIAYQTLDRLTAGSVFRFLALSETVKISNCRALRVPLEIVSVIPRGRDASLFERISPAQVDSLRSSLRIQEKSPVILNVARLISRKGQTELIQSMRAVIQSIPNATLLIAGEGPYRKALQNLVDRNGLENHVHLLGNRNDIPALLRLADLFVFPSHYEGQGGAIVEAMMAAKAIIASDTPVHRESLQNQVSALLYSVGDTHALEQAILWMLNHPQQASQMGTQARETAKNKFSIETIAAATESFYEQTLIDWNTRQ